MTGCPACDEVQRKTGTATALCSRCACDMAAHEYMLSKKRFKMFALAKRQEENDYKGEENVD